MLNPNELNEHANYLVKKGLLEKFNATVRNFKQNLTLHELLQQRRNKILNTFRRVEAKKKLQRFLRQYAIKEADHIDAYLKARNNGKESEKLKNKRNWLFL